MVPGQGRGADRRPGAPVSGARKWGFAIESRRPDLYSLMLGDTVVARGLTRERVIELGAAVVRELRDNVSTDARLAIALAKLEALTREINTLAGRANRILEDEP